MNWIRDNMKLFEEWYLQLYDRKDVSLPIVRAKIKVLFYFPDAADRDLDNKYTTLADCMVAAGILAKDSFTVLKPIHLDGWIKRDKPRTEIYLTIIPSGSKEYEVDKTDSNWNDAMKKRRSVQQKIRRDKNRRRL